MTIRADLLGAEINASKRTGAGHEQSNAAKLLEFQQSSLEGKKYACCMYAIENHEMYLKHVYMQVIIVKYICKWHVLFLPVCSVSSSKPAAPVVSFSFRK